MLRFLKAGLIAALFVTPFAGLALGQAGMEFGPAGKIVAPLYSNGAAPVLSSCGTGATVSGNSFAGRVVTGSGATTCTITFATTPGATFSSVAPACILHAEVATQPTYTVSATAITVATSIASTAYNYVCVRPR